MQLVEDIQTDPQLSMFRVNSNGSVASNKMLINLTDQSNGSES